MGVFLSDTDFGKMHTVQMGNWETGKHMTSKCFLSCLYNINVMCHVYICFDLPKDQNWVATCCFAAMYVVYLVWVIISCLYSGGEHTP